MNPNDLMVVSLTFHQMPPAGSNLSLTVCEIYPDILGGLPQTLVKRSMYITVNITVRFGTQVHDPHRVICNNFGDPISISPISLWSNIVLSKLTFPSALATC